MQEIDFFKEEHALNYDVFIGRVDYIFFLEMNLHFQ